MTGTVRSLTDYGAFVDLGGVDGLLHVSDISWGRVNKPADVLTVGQEIEAKVLKIDAGEAAHFARHEAAAAASLGFRRRKVQDRRASARHRHAVTDFGAFVELEPGIEGLIHISEMSWVKKVRKPSDLVKPGDTVEAVILGVNVGEQRIVAGTEAGARRSLG